MPVSVGIRAFWRWLESSAGSGGVGAVQLGVSAGFFDRHQRGIGQRTSIEIGDGITDTALRRILRVLSNYAFSPPHGRGPCWPCVAAKYLRQARLLVVRQIGKKISFKIKFHVPVQRHWI